MNPRGRVVAAKWFASSICIVRVLGVQNGVSYYIGYTDSSDKYNAQIDIAKWGARYPKLAGDVLFKIKR